MLNAMRLSLIAVSLCGSMAAAAPVDGAATYDLLFRNGTLDEIDQSDALVYRRAVTNELKPDAADRDTGEIEISYREDTDAMVQLKFTQAEKHRALGVFPASVGNPMIMYFYETVVRDMAEAAGGSPFYIRNRVKDALIQTSDMQTGSAVIDGETIDTVTITLYPFANDPNIERMKGFGALELSVTMSEDVPGWYLSLIADTPSDDGAPSVYRSELMFDRLEAGADQ